VSVSCEWEEKKTQAPHRVEACRETDRCGLCRKTGKKWQRKKNTRGPGQAVHSEAKGEKKKTDEGLQALGKLDEGDTRGPLRKAGEEEVGGGTKQKEEKENPGRCGRTSENKRMKEMRLVTLSRGG